MMTTSEQSTPSRWQRGWPVLWDCRAQLAKQFAQVMLMSFAIAVLLWMSRSSISFASQLAYSLPMGVICWSMIDIGRFFIDQDNPQLFPRGYKGPALVGVALLVSFVLGTAVGDAYNGWSTWDLIEQAPRRFAYILLFSLIVGAAISLYFYQRGKESYLLAVVQTRERQATEAKLKLLQSQLDPHMLFNTLANLRVLIQSEPARAVQMLDQLNDFLRASLAASRASEHSLQAEFDRLHDYLSLMQIRMGKRLEFSLKLPPELAPRIVPTLILQSLVENAVLHGLEPKVGGGYIAISASQEAQHLVLQVTDDGLGFDTAQHQEGFGLTQVRERLHSRYGTQATIELIALSAYNIRALGQKDLKNNSEISLHYSPDDHITGQRIGSQVTLRIPLLV